jgi:oxygen-independent coproporphyrinogen III oxidase
MFIQEKQESNVPALGLYAHVPFCSTTCDFCAFYQERPSKKRIEEFFLGLERELERFPGDRTFSTVFIGGGTPGLLSSTQLEHLCRLINQAGLSKRCEWTLEVAPSEITREKLDVLADGGVNRISLGVQTFDPKMMESLGRRHTVEKTLSAYALIREIEAFRVNLDLIFGAPGQTIEMWEADLKCAVELQPDHLSTYCLTFEEDTAMYVRLSEGKVELDVDREAEFYEKAWSLLPSLGYAQYEISNFSKPGMSCQHNVNTWRMNEWIGYGPYASTQHLGVRRKNSANLEKWSTGMAQGNSPVYDEHSVVGKRDLVEDSILFGLRMNDGVNLDELAQRFDVPSEWFGSVRAFFGKLTEEGLMRDMEGFSVLTPTGRMRCDAIAAEMPEVEGQVP